MAYMEFTIRDLRRIMHESAGQGDGGDVEIATMDTEFTQLGYESLALLETGSRIEREFGIRLDDSDLFDSPTPRALIEAVNAQLTLRQAA
jgi:act minimal PKS acyl carrier protein